MKGRSGRFDGGGGLIQIVVDWLKFWIEVAVWGLVSVLANKVAAGGKNRLERIDDGEWIGIGDGGWIAID